MKQGNPQRKIGRVAALSAMINNMVSMGSGGVYTKDMMHQKNSLLTNGGVAPIPHKFLNQRQKRKRAKHAGAY